MQINTNNSEWRFLVYISDLYSEFIRNGTWQHTPLYPQFVEYSVWVKSSLGDLFVNKGFAISADRLKMMAAMIGANQISMKKISRKKQRELFESVLAVVNLELTEFFKPIHVYNSELRLPEFTQKELSDLCDHFVAWVFRIYRSLEDGVEVW